VDEPSSIASSDALRRLLFDQAGTAMVAADLTGRINAWNHAAALMFGAGANEMIGANWTSIVPLEERAEAEVMMARSLREGESSELEFAFRDERGESRRLAAIITPIADAQGERIGGLACVRDITNRMILIERLAQQSKMAALGEMAGALAHHFNNILGGVVTSVDFALASGNPDILGRVLEKTAAALSRATELVENLLAFAEGDFRDASLSDLSEVMVEIVEGLDQRLRGTEIGVQLDVRSIPVVEVPRSQVLTVVSNLIDNAIEAMPEGGTLTVSLGADDANAIITIGDTGHGLDTEAMGRIFEPFFSTKGRSATGRSSRGLGLAVAHGVLKVLRGDIRVKSTLGEGTTFEVRLPLRRNEGSGPGEASRLG
jgi:PAS domain S-box-containing protein